MSARVGARLADWLTRPAAIFAVALAARVAVALWAFDRIPPTADGAYYDVIAKRIAAGEGYTWAWPDGTITYAAHYPVGYPALMAFVYLVAGPRPGAVMLVNALLGAAGAWFTHRAAMLATGDTEGGPRRSSVPAALAGWAVALHPALLSYTPALMTEGVTTTLLGAALAAVGFARRRRGALVGFITLGLVLGVATFVRPQTIVLAPLFAVVAARGDGSKRGSRGWGRVGALAALTTAAALVVVSPWTARNCSRMGRCALVSVNGGWNLAIGTDREANGSWAALKVPEPCKTEFDEAEKDVCFGREAAKEIARDPLGWLALAPHKLHVTFTYFGAGPWYLHAANEAAFSSRAKVAWAAAEIVFQRGLLGAALFAVARPCFAGFERRRRRVLVGLCAALALVPTGWVGVLAFAGLAWAAARREGPATALAFRAAALVVATTAATHAVFFGAGRYGLVIIPALALGLVGLGPRKEPQGF
ncbi:MAG: hypothetical protein U0271_18630 [Polyangiaceae bacterium]